MPVIKPASVRDLKLRVNLADVISRVVTLRKAGGARLKGLCPFHNEKTPSFHVNTDKGFYKCFGCGKAGDAITFVRETEQLNFTEAVEAIGKRFGRRFSTCTTRRRSTITRPSRRRMRTEISSGPTGWRNGGSRWSWPMSS